MSHRTISAALLALAGCALLAAAGCSAYGPNNFTLGGWGAVPIPVTPFLQDELEDRFWDKERYDTVPILGPITEGGPTMALDPPSQDEIMRALEEARPLEGGIPLLFETQRNNVRIVLEPLADYIDPPRPYPLIGPAQLHHAHYKATIYFTEITRVGWPIPHTKTNGDAQEVIYLDHNHFHLVGNVDGGPSSEY